MPLYRVVDTTNGNILADGFDCIADAQAWVRTSGMELHHWVTVEAA